MSHLLLMYPFMRKFWNLLYVTKCCKLSLLSCRLLYRLASSRVAPPRSVGLYGYMSGLTSLRAKVTSLDCEECVFKKVTP